MNFRNHVEVFFDKTLDILFPIRRGNIEILENETETIIDLLNKVLELNIESGKMENEEVVKSFMDQILTIKNKLNKDIEALYQGDPAAISRNEVIIAYPGFFAIAAYRIGHALLQLGVPLIPRIITEHAKSYTGIDIHPGATIGEYLCIDHGTGVVIGETTVIGDNVKLYQGVTLGAMSIPKTKSSEKRHPTIKDNVIIYAQAIILGGATVIGEGSVIGGNVWLTESVPPKSKVYYKGTNGNENPFKNIIVA